MNLLNSMRPRSFWADDERGLLCDIRMVLLTINGSRYAIPISESEQISDYCTFAFTQAVESGSVDDLIENRARKARPPPNRIESSPEIDEPAGADDDEWGGGGSAKKSASSKRTRGRPRAGSPPGLKRKRPTAPMKAPSVTPSLDEEDEIPESVRLVPVLSFQTGHSLTLTLSLTTTFRNDERRPLKPGRLYPRLCASA